MSAREAGTLTLVQFHALRRAWVDRERRLEDRAARQALFLAAKVWDTEGKVSVEDLFPMLDPTAEMTEEERQRAEWKRVKAIFAAASPRRGDDGVVRGRRI